VWIFNASGDQKLVILLSLNKKKLKNVTKYRDSRTAKSKKGKDNHIEQLSIQTPYISFFIICVFLKRSL